MGKGRGEDQLLSTQVSIKIGSLVSEIKIITQRYLVQDISILRTHSTGDRIGYGDENSRW